MKWIAALVAVPYVLCCLACCAFAFAVVVLLL